MKAGVFLLTPHQRENQQDLLNVSPLSCLAAGFYPITGLLTHPVCCRDDRARPSLRLLVAPADHAAVCDDGMLPVHVFSAF